MPRVNGQLLVNLSGTELCLMSETGTVASASGPVAVLGVLTRRFVIDTEQKRKICGVEFEPGGFSAFTSEHATYFCDKAIDASKIWGIGSGSLHSALAMTDDPHGHCKILEAFLNQQFIPDPFEDVVFQKLLNGMVSGRRIQDIQQELGLSQRKLHDLFDRRIGVRPKLFARILRLSSGLSVFQEQPSLADLAYESGYSDQSHLSREFRRLAGTSPGAHKPVVNEPNHGELGSDKTFKT